MAVVTGGAGGIGSALARAFAARGAKIVLADLDAANLDVVVRRLAADGARVLGVPTDVTKPESVEALAEATLSRFGAAHVVCNNAGVATFGPIATSTAKDWEFTMNVNFWGVVHGVQSFVPRLIAQRQGGHVVRAIERGDLYILTHPEQREILRRRAERLDAAFQDWDLD